MKTQVVTRSGWHYAIGYGESFDPLLYFAMEAETLAPEQIRNLNLAAALLQPGQYLELIP